MSRLTSLEVKNFQKRVYTHFRKHGRKLPWRRTRNPYRILVSEIMLQQTQVDRVIPKYLEFLSAFPTVNLLSSAPLARILSTWQGLGYNRRAVHLKNAAQKIIREYQGRIPETPEELEKFPGIGRNTACAIAVFAYNKPVVFIETNIRSVYIHEFFKNSNRISDEELIPYIRATLDEDNARKWYSALMDYGSSLKKSVANPSRKSRHHTKQKKFNGSNRQLRGIIVRSLLAQPRTIAELSKIAKLRPDRTRRAVQELLHEGLVVRHEKTFMIA